MLSEKCRDLFDLLRWTGARPGELLSLSWGKIDRTKTVWIADLDHHKTAHKGKRRRLYFGPRAQLILRRLNTGDADRLLSRCTTTRSPKPCARV